MEGRGRSRGSRRRAEEGNEEVKERVEGGAWRDGREEGEEEWTEEKRGEEGGTKVIFWNVARLRNKDTDFWKGLKDWDIMLFVETWVDRKGWERVKEMLPKGYVWEVQFAERKNKKGRAMGGMVLGIREKIEKGKNREVERGEEVLSKKICLDGEWWRVVGVYVNRDLDKVRNFGGMGGGKGKRGEVIGGRGF